MDIDRRARGSAVSLVGISGVLQPEQEMANFFAAELEKGRVEGAPYSPCAVPAALANQHWAPRMNPTWNHSRDGNRARPSSIATPVVEKFRRGNTSCTGCASFYPVIYRVVGRISGDLAPILITREIRSRYRLPTMSGLP